MAALASPPVSSGLSRAPAGTPRDDRPASFTAVNGSYQRGPEGDSHTIGDTITVQSEKQSAYRDSHNHSRPTPPPSRQENLYMEYRNGSIDQQQLPSPTETSVNSAKRKRSISEDEISPSMPPSQRPQMRHGHQHSFDEEHYRQQPSHHIQEIPSDGEQGLNEDRSRQRSGETSRTSPSSTRPESYSADPQQLAEPLSSESDRPNRGFPSSNNSSRWEQPSSYPQGYQDETRNPPPEGSNRPGSSQISSEHQGPHPGGWAFPHSHQESNEPEENNYQDQGQPQTNPKRKRNFSNRTKTGCMTCRKRKKKCDEAHPFCQNCSRGGFTCEGYSSRASWPKTNNPKAPVPLQSKDEQDNTFVPGGQSPRPAGPQLSSMVATNPFPPRPVGQEAHESSRGYAPSPASATSTVQPQYPSSWPPNNQSPYSVERRPDFRDLPPIQNPNRLDSQRDYAGVPPMSEISQTPLGHAPPPSAGPWAGQSPSDSRSAYAPPAAAPAAQPVDSRSDNRQVPTARPLDSKVPPTLVPMSERAEKDKMIKGHLFKFMDPQLQDERAFCREALWRLNNAETPQFGISVFEKQRLLEEVLRGARFHRNEYSGPPAKEKPQGSIGPEAYVELPFKCHYGYNIHIGEKAYIGENCTIVDACKVTIGAKTWIGSNVTILTAMAHTDLQHRQGADSAWQGKEVIIEEDVYIGANVMIYPGVKLARGAFIEPGSIVKQDQPQYGYLGYKPMYLSQSTPPV